MCVILSLIQVRFFMMLEGDTVKSTRSTQHVVEKKQGLLRKLRECPVTLNDSVS